MNAAELYKALESLATNGRGDVPVAVQVGKELHFARTVEVPAQRQSRRRPREVFVVLGIDPIAAQ